VRERESENLGIEKDRAREGVPHREREREKRERERAYM